MNIQDLCPKLLSSAPEGGVAHEKLKNQNSQSPEVDAHALICHLVDFWWPVLGRPAGCSQGLLPLNLSTPPKVAYSHLVSISEEHVFWLQIAVNTVMLMEAGDALENLCKVAPGSCLGESTLRLLHAEGP